MMVATGLFALALAGWQAAPAPEAPRVEYQIRVLDMKGLEWRGKAHGRLTPVARRGTAAVWTADRSIVDELSGQSARVVCEPNLSANPSLSATVREEVQRSYVADLRRVADGPYGHATAVAYQPTVERIPDAFEAAVACRRIDQGVLASVQIEHSWVAAVHTVVTGERLEPAKDKERTSGATQLNARFQVPEVVTDHVAGEWLIPNDGVLVIGLGAHTLTTKDGKAEVHERVALIEAKPGAGCVVEPTPEGFRVGSVITTTGRGPALAQVPDEGMTLPSLPPYYQGSVQFFPPGPDFPWANTQAATQRARMLAMGIDSAGMPAPPVPEGVASIPNHARPITSAAPMVAVSPMPAPPNRNLPRPIGPDGKEAALPPLPAEDHLAIPADADESDEPLASPQTRAARAEATEPGAIDVPEDEAHPDDADTIHDFRRAFNDFAARHPKAAVGVLLTDRRGVSIFDATTCPASAETRTCPAAAAKGECCEMDHEGDCDACPDDKADDRDEASAQLGRALEAGAMLAFDAVSTRVDAALKVVEHVVNHVGAAIAEANPESRSDWNLSLSDAIRIGIENAGCTRSIGIDTRQPTQRTIIGVYPPKGKEQGYAAELSTLVRTIEQRYWELSACQSKADATGWAMNTVENILKSEEAKCSAGAGSKPNCAEAAEQRERCRLDHVAATSAAITAERQLRDACGLPAADGRRIVAGTQPTVEPVALDWENCLASMIARRLADDREQSTTCHAALHVAPCLPTAIIAPVCCDQSAESVVAEMEQAARKATQQATHDLARVFLTLDSARKTAATADRLKSAAGDRLQAMKAHYEEGKVTIDRYLDAVGRWSNALAQEAETRCHYRAAVVALEETRGTLLASKDLLVINPARTVAMPAPAAIKRDDAAVRTRLNPTPAVPKVPSYAPFAQPKARCEAGGECSEGEGCTHTSKSPVDGKPAPAPNETHAAFPSLPGGDMTDIGPDLAEPRSYPDIVVPATAASESVIEFGATSSKVRYQPPCESVQQGGLSGQRFKLEVLVHPYFRFETRFAPNQ